jgi:hypothetical protein
METNLETVTDIVAATSRSGRKTGALIAGAAALLGASVYGVGKLVGRRRASKAAKSEVIETTETPSK